MPNLLSEVEYIDGDSRYTSTIYDQSAHDKISVINNNISALQTNVDAILSTIDHYNYVNALDAGVVPMNDTESVRTSNTSIVNNLLAQGKFVYFPDNGYFFNDTIVINKHAGIIGQSMDGVVFNTSTLGDCIRVDIDAQSPDLQEQTWISFVLKNFRIYCDQYPNSNGAGIRLRNVTWEVTANQDLTRYIEIRGNGYALEIRNSVCENIHISGFKNGLESGLYISYGYFNNFFIDSCTEYGVYNKCSDTIYTNFVITFCYNGFYEQCEENKFCNICIKQNGRRYEFDAAHPVGGSIGLHCVGSRQDTFTNLELQENGATGGVIDTCHDMMLIGVIVDANGFNPANFGTNDTGLNLVNGCYNIFGDVTATNKNGPSYTQRLGLFVQDSCTGISLRYQESNQRMKVYQLDGRRTIGSLNNTFLNRVNTIVSEDFVASPHAFATYDGHNINVDIQGYYSIAKAANTTLFQWGGIFGENINPVSNNYYNSGRINVMLINATDGTFIKAHINDVQELVCDEAIPAAKQIALNITLAVWLNFD